MSILDCVDILNKIVRQKYFLGESVSMSQQKILVIEDNNELAYQIQVRLEAEGYSIQLAENGHVGLEMARESNPDLILLDLMLPEVDGYRVCRLLKFDTNHEHTPII